MILDAIDNLKEFLTEWTSENGNGICAVFEHATTRPTQYPYAIVMPANVEVTGGCDKEICYTLRVCMAMLLDKCEIKSPAPERCFWQMTHDLFCELGLRYQIEGDKCFTYEIQPNIIYGSDTDVRGNVTKVEFDLKVCISCDCE